MTDFEAQMLALVARCAVALERQATAIEASVAKRVAAGAAPEMTDAELDNDDRADVQIRKDPKSWKGAPMAGKRFSQCTPEYLENFANACEFKAQREHDEAKDLQGEERAKKLKYSGYSKLDAKRARGWARRMRAGWTAPEAAKPGNESWRKPAAPAEAPKATEDKGYPSDWDSNEPSAPPAAAAPKAEDAPPADWAD